MANQLEHLAELTPKQLKRTLGRPTKYNSTILTKAIEYLRTYQDNGEPIPTKEGMALALGIDRRTLMEWNRDKDKAEFSHIVSVMDSQQARDIIAGGVRGDIPSKVVSLLLYQHGYSEASQGVSGVSITVNVQRDFQDLTIEGELVDDKSTT